MPREKFTDLVVLLAIDRVKSFTKAAAHSAYRNPH